MASVTTKEYIKQRKQIKTQLEKEVADAKALFDAATNRESSGLRLKEPRSALELDSLKESLQEQGTLLRWVHSEANLADALTKPQAKHVLQLFLQRRRWKIMFDPLFQSSKNRKKIGLKKLEGNTREEQEED